MILLQSAIENFKGDFIQLDRLFNEKGFVLGGGYEYDHGYYDKALDWEENKEHRAYLRVPVTAIDGSIGTRTATLQIGKPFILKHVYQTQENNPVNAGLISSTFNQFAEPEDPDARLESKWIQRGQSELEQLEHHFQKNFKAE